MTAPPIAEKRCCRCGVTKPTTEFARTSPRCRICNNEAARRWRAKDPLHSFRANIWQKYRLTVEQYEEILARQGGHCALCPATHGKQRLHVDHDHRCCPGKKTCGKCVRGILCYSCNTRISIIDSETDYAVRARAYLNVTVSRA